MKRLSACLLLSLALAAGASAADQAEVIVLLDTSESMFDYIDPVMEYVIGSVVEDYIALGDNFHILTFAETAQMELSQSVRTNADLRAIISRLYLLYPFGANTDLASAIDYLDQYAADLSDSSLKNIIIITDGIHNPGASSPYAGRPAADIEGAIRASIKSMKERGWRVSFIRVPFKADAQGGSGENGNPLDFSQALKDELGDSATDFNEGEHDAMTEAAMGLISVTFPAEDLGKKNSRFTLPLKIRNSTNADVSLELVACDTEFGDVLEEKSFLKIRAGKTDLLRARLRMPESLEAGPVTLPVRLDFAGRTRVVPGSGTLSFTLSREPLSSFLNATFLAPSKIILLILIVLLVIALVIFFILIVRQSPSGTAIARLGRRKDEEEASLKASMGIQGTDSYVPPSRYTDGYAAGAALSKGKAAASGNERFIGAKEAGASANKAGKGAEAPAFTIARGGKAEKAEGPMAKTASPFSFSEDAAEAKRQKEEARRLRKEEEAADAEGRRAAAAALRSLRVKAQGNVQVEFSINEQTHLVGFRNIHSIKSGSRFIVGGMRSADFLVFVVKVPSRLAQVFYDGEKLSFVPVRPEYFPGIDGMLEDCLDKPIRCVTPTGYEMTMAFKQWENPALKFNRLLDLVDLTGSRGLR